MSEDASTVSVPTPHAEEGSARYPADPWVGREIGGCRLLRPLGEGGMGAVYLARHLALAKPVVVKLMHPGVARARGASERFLREARAAARLEHPNIAQVLHAGVEADGERFIVMQLVEGESLSDRIDREGRLSIGDAARIARDVGRALAAAHAAGIIHRDVKPSNVLLARSGEVRVVDFGLAKSIAAGLPGEGNGDGDGEGDYDDAVTAAGTILGTPYYMAPEQARGHALDGRADLYALGATLFLMLTGQRPIDGRPLDVLSRLSTERPPDVRSIRPDAPAALAELVAALLEKAAGDRPPSADAVVAALDALLARGDGSNDPRIARLPPHPCPLPRGEGEAVRFRESLVLLPGGSFRRGSDAGHRDQRPARTVRLRAFLLDRAAVTMAEYAAFLTAARAAGGHVPGCCHASEPAGKDHRPGLDAPWARELTWPSDEPPRGLERNPVVLVDWFDAFAFAAWAGKRLPTEAEREYASGGRHGFEYPWGQEAPTPERASFGRRDRGPSPSDRRQAGRSPEGVLDLAGNVWEWCGDVYSAVFYARSADSDPVNEAAGAAERVVRGGSFREPLYRLRRTERFSQRPDARLLDLGFRCAGDAPAPV